MDVVLTELMFLGVIVVVLTFDLFELFGAIGLEGRFDVWGFSFASSHTLGHPISDILLILPDFLGILLQPLIFLSFHPTFLEGRIFVGI